MRSFVSRHKPPDRTSQWIIAFAVAYAATIVASAYALIVATRAAAWVLGADKSLFEIFSVQWHVWVPLSAYIGYITITGRNGPVFPPKPSALLYDALERIGATRVPEDARDRHLRRLVNVNEEIAIAAGCYPAQLYVQQNDESINALTLGDSSAPTICVTRGAIRLLKRAELQAVIAHEYGHVANDDVRDNMRLLHWLGALLPHGVGENRYRALRVVGWCTGIGLSCLLIAWGFDAAGGVLGSLGSVISMVATLFIAIAAAHALTPVWRFGADATRMTQAGFTRQRELEADALSAQFTREPEALANVLRKIAGLRADSGLDPRDAAMFAHMCIASGLFGTDRDRFATHPTLAERLDALGSRLTDEERRRLAENPHDAIEQYAAEVNAELGILYAAQPGEMLPPEEPLPHEEQPTSPAAPSRRPPGMAVVAPFEAKPSIERAVQLLGGFPEDVRRSLRAWDGAWAAAHALISERRPVGSTEEQWLRVRLFSSTLARLGETARLPLLELAIPVLRSHPARERQALVASLRIHMEVGESVDLRGFVYFLLLTKPLQVTRPPPGRMNLSKACSLLFSAAARSFTNSEAEARAAYARARARLDPHAELPSSARLEPLQLERALDRLCDLGDGRGVVLEALAALVSHDERIEVREVEFVRAVALAIQWPMPPLAATAEAV